jgi:hypothetical protein
MNSYAWQYTHAQKLPQIILVANYAIATKSLRGNINFCHQIITWQIKEHVATTSYRSSRVLCN